MNLNGTTILTYADIRTISSGFTIYDVPGNFCPVQGKGNTFQGMPDKNAERYPVLWVYSWPAPSFRSNGLWIPIRDLLLT